MCNGDVLTLLKHCYQVWQIDLAFCFAQGSVASTCSAGLSKCAALCTARSTMRTRLYQAVWPEALRPLLCAPRPTVLTNPEPCSADFLSAHTALPRVHSNWAHPRCVSMPSCNDTDYIRKMIIWKIFFVVYSITIKFGCTDSLIIFSKAAFHHRRVVQSVNCGFNKLHCTYMWAMML